MSLFDYKESRRLAEADTPFYALVMAAMWKASTTNGDRLREAFPDVWDELQARYNALGGLLPGEGNERVIEAPDGVS